MIVKWKEQVLSLNPYQPGKSIEEVRKELGLEQIVKLASNENPYGQSPKVREAFVNLMLNYAIYPDGYATDFRETLASFLQVDSKQLIFGNGTDEVIEIISRALLEENKNTVMAEKTFPQYKHNAILDGAEIREVPIIEGAHDLDGMLAAIDENTAIVWLCSPNNPTGIYIAQQQLEDFLAKVPKEVLVVLDEAYGEYVTADDYGDTISLLALYPNLMITRTFSKIYGLAGFRVGYGIASEDVITKLESVRQPFNTNVLGQRAAAIALSDQDFVAECRRLNREGLERLYAFCDEHQLGYYPSEGNFILIDFGCDGEEVFQFLLRQGYIVRSGPALGFPTCVRITVGNEAQITGLIEAMTRFLEENK